MLRAVAYARYSSDNQRAESITAQLRAIHSYALKESIEIIKEYIDEAETATSDERPDFQNMIKEIEKTKPDLVLVHKLDRFARDRIDAGHYRWLLKKKGARLVAVEQDFGNGPEAALMESTVEGVAEYFSKNLSREVKKGLFENVIQGKHCGGLPPLGYDIDPDKMYIINEHEAQAIRMIFDMKIQNMNYQMIMDALNKAGYRSKRGKIIGKNSLHDILRNEKYIGNYIYRKTSSSNSRVAADPLATVRIEGIIPRIIDDETFYKAQSMMDGSKQQPRMRSDTVYILSGIAKCGECGQAMTGSSHVNRGRKYEYYRCNNANRTGGKSCSNLYRYKRSTLEQDVIERTQEALDILRANIDNEIDVIYEAIINKTESENAERQSLQKEIRKIKIEIDNLINSVAAGVDAKILAPKINDLGRKKDALEKRKNRIEINNISKDVVREYLLKIINTSINPEEPVTCREVLKVLLDEVIIYDKNNIYIPLERFGLAR